METSDQAPSITITTYLAMQTNILFIICLCKLCNLQRVKESKKHLENTLDKTNIQLNLLDVSRFVSIFFCTLLNFISKIFCYLSFIHFLFSLSVSLSTSPPNSGSNGVEEYKSRKWNLLYLMKCLFCYYRHDSWWLYYQTLLS